MAEKPLSVHRCETLSQYEAAALALSWAMRYDPAEQDLANILAGAQLYAVTREGRVVLFYALRIMGETAWIEAAAGQCYGVNLTRTFLPAIEQQAKDAGCKSLGMATLRRGLLAKLQAQGYQITGRFGTGVTLRKALQ